MVRCQVECITLEGCWGIWGCGSSGDSGVKMKTVINLDCG